MLALLRRDCLKFTTKCSSGEGTVEWLICFWRELLSWESGIRLIIISSTFAAQCKMSSKDKFVTSDNPTKKCPNRSSPSSVCRRRPEIAATRHDVAIRQGETSRKDDSVADRVMRSSVCLRTVLAIFFNRTSFVWGCRSWCVNSWFRIVYGVTAARSQLSILKARSSHSYWRKEICF